MPTPRLYAALSTAVATLACAVNISTAAERKDVSSEEFKRLVGEAEFARLLRAAEEKLISEATFSIEREGSVVRFSGLISPKAAASLAGVLADYKVKEVWIESGGGDVEAGQRIGRLIRDRGLVVVVTGACISSCANYLFTAGKRRVVRPGGFVVWHGSSFQKDGREFDRCGRIRSSLDGMVWTPEDIAERSRDIEGVSRRQQGDLDFFASIGVDEYITRVGQEPRFYGNFTMTVADMAKFGLTNVEAEAEYGSSQFCRAHNRRMSPTLHCLAVTDHMLAYERARRALGEVCQADGTLRIRTSRD